MPPTARNLCAGLPPRDVITRRFHGENGDYNLIQTCYNFMMFQVDHHKLFTFSTLAVLGFPIQIEVCGSDGGLNGVRWHWHRRGWHCPLARGLPLARWVAGSLPVPAARLRARRMLS